jgi:hypothetical protein
VKKKQNDVASERKMAAYTRRLWYVTECFDEAPDVTNKDFLAPNQSA